MACTTFITCFWKIISRKPYMQTTNNACWLNQQITSVLANLANTYLSAGFHESPHWDDPITYSQSKLQSYLSFGTEICMVKVLST